MDEYKPKHSKPLALWQELRNMGKEQKAISEGTAEPYVGKHRRGQWPAIKREEPNAS